MSETTKTHEQDELINGSLTQGVPDTNTRNLKSPRGNNSTPRTRRFHSGKYIKRSQYDDVASFDLERIRVGEVDSIRPAFKVPADKYADVKSVLALKRQSFQEATWALWLAELARLEKKGEFQPVFKQTSI